MRAIWNGAVLAESDETIVVDNNHYFPPASINREYFTESATHSVCSWKGVASYLTVQVGEAANPDAAWYYPEPKDKATELKNHLAFWKGVTVEP